MSELQEEDEDALPIMHGQDNMMEEAQRGKAISSFPSCLFFRLSGRLTFFAHRLNNFKTYQQSPRFSGHYHNEEAAPPISSRHRSSSAVTAWIASPLFDNLTCSPCVSLSPRIVLDIVSCCFIARLFFCTILFFFFVMS